MTIVGIDPGLSGAICFFKAGAGLSVVDMPVLSLVRGGKNRREIDGRRLAELLSDPRPEHVFVEEIWGRAHNAVSGFASASLLIAYGRILGIVDALPISLTKVSPQRWKRTLAVPKGKDAARARASELMPEFASLWRLKKHDGRAEAALLAYYGEMFMKNPRSQPRPGNSEVDMPYGGTLKVKRHANASRNSV